MRLEVGLVAKEMLSVEVYAKVGDKLRQVFLDCVCVVTEVVISKTGVSYNAQAGGLGFQFDDSSFKDGVVVNLSR